MRLPTLSSSSLSPGFLFLSLILSPRASPSQARPMKGLCTHHGAAPAHFHLPHVPTTPNTSQQGRGLQEDTCEQAQCHLALPDPNTEGTGSFSPAQVSPQGTGTHHVTGTLPHCLCEEPAPDLKQTNNKPEHANQFCN